MKACIIFARKAIPIIVPAAMIQRVLGLLDGPHQAVGAGDHHQDQQGVGVVEAEHQRGDGSQREDRPGRRVPPRRRTSA